MRRDGTQTDGRGTTLTFVYDDLGRMTSRKRGTTVLAEWTYGTSTTNNQKGRLIKSRINGNDIIAGTSYDIDFAYHDGGAIDTITYPLVPGASVREVVDHVYDGLGNPFSLDGDHTYVDSASWTYTGAPDVWVLGDGADITRSWSYDRSTLRLGTIRAGTTQLSGTWNLVDLFYTHTDSGNHSNHLE